MEYKTQMEAAKKGIVTKELAAVAKKRALRKHSSFRWWHPAG